jgi:hypothetical protein
MSEPVRITKNATAGDLSECLGWLGEEIQNRVEAQTRKDVADALRDSFVDRSQTYCKYSDTPDDSIIEALRLSKVTKGRLQALASRFDNEGVPADFRLGLEFAIAMIRDQEFEL